MVSPGSIQAFQQFLGQEQVLAGEADCLTYAYAAALIWILSVICGQLSA